MYRFDEDDEGRLVRIARSIDMPVNIFLTMMDRPSSSFHRILEYTRQTQKEYLNEFAEEDERIEILPEGEQLFRNYSALKNLSITTVILSEAGVAAEKYGLELKVIAPEDTKKDQIAVEQLPSYINFRKQKNKGQQTALEQLNKIKIPEETYNALTKRLQSQMITQTPFATIGPDKYLCFVRQLNSIRNQFILFTKENKFPIDELIFYDTEWGKDTDFFEQAMQQ